MDKEKKDCWWYHDQEDKAWISGCGWAFPLLVAPAWNDCPKCSGFIVLGQPKKILNAMSEDEPKMYHDHMCPCGKDWLTYTQIAKRKILEIAGRFDETYNPSIQEILMELDREEE